MVDFSILNNLVFRFEDFRHIYRISERIEISMDYRRTTGNSLFSFIRISLSNGVTHKINITNMGPSPNTNRRIRNPIRENIFIGRSYIAI